MRRATSYPVRSRRWNRLAPLVVAACVACTPPAATPTPSGGTPPTPAPALPPAPATPDRVAPRAALELVSRTAVNSPTFRSLGLTGENKPNGLQYRLRQSVPANTPPWVSRTRDGMELFIADETPDGWLALYRTPLAQMQGSRNPRFRAVLRLAPDAIMWDLDLTPLLSRPDHLEIQDVRYADGRLYFNEGCQSYSREAGGQCSSLVRVDPRAGRVEWRTAPLTSNNVFLVHGPYVVAGYGFTAEPDALFLLDRATGRVLATHGLDSAHSYLEFRDGDLFVVTQGSLYRFRVPTGAM